MARDLGAQEVDAFELFVQRAGRLVEEVQPDRLFVLEDGEIHRAQGALSHHAPNRRLTDKEVERDDIVRCFDEDRLSILAELLLLRLSVDDRLDQEQPRAVDVHARREVGEVALVTPCA